MEDLEPGFGFDCRFFFLFLFSALMLPKEFSC